MKILFLAFLLVSTNLLACDFEDMDKLAYEMIILETTNGSTYNKDQV